MERLNVGACNVKAGLLSDTAYLDTLRLVCSRSRRRIYASLFIVDISSQRNALPLVPEFLEDLSLARRRGVDVHIMIGGSNNNLPIQDISEAAKQRCDELQLPCKIIALAFKNSSHKKIIVADDVVILGSHNWSHGAFSGQIQDSILLADPRLACYFATQLDHEWQALERSEANVQI